MSDFDKLKAIADSNGDIVAAPIPQNVVQITSNTKGAVVAIGVSHAIGDRLRNGEMVGALYLVGSDEWEKDEFNPPPTEATELRYKIEALRKMIWGADITSPCCPEYVEWHENCQKFLNYIDNEILGGSDGN